MRASLVAPLLFASLAPAQSPQMATGQPSPGAVSIRLLFGMDRLTPERWDGRIQVSSGRIVALGGVHFEGRDKIVPPDGWLVTNRVTRYADSSMPRGYDPVHTRPYAMIPNGVVATLEAQPGARVTVETAVGDFDFALDELRFGAPRFFLDGRARAERVPTTVTLTSGEPYDDYPALAQAQAGGMWASWITYANERDAVWLARNEGGRWGRPIRITPEDYADNFRTAVVESEGRAVVIWSGKSPAGQWGLFARSWANGRLSPVEAIAGRQVLYHRAVAAANGRVHAVWQTSQDGAMRISHSVRDGDRWSAPAAVSSGSADAWAPDIAADSSGAVWVGWDGYEAGDFNVYVRRLSADGQWQPARQITRAPTFDANVSLACDAQNRLWIAWDHGEPNWGKDWSSQRFRPGGGAGLYRTRAVKVAVLEGEQLRQPPSLMDPVPPEWKDYIQQARLVADGDGRIWAMLRSLTSTSSRVDNNWGAGGIWEMLLTRLDGDGWSTPTRLHSTSGRNDVWAAAARDTAGKLWFAWASDARPFGSPDRAIERGRPAERTTHVSYAIVDPAALALAGRGTPTLGAFEEPALSVIPVHPTETADTTAIRNYRSDVGGKSYRILRGDLHRHTDISADGIGEGGLIDFYRYALTAGQYDFMLVTDHQYGGDDVPAVEYNWWRTEKSEDIFLVPGRFWPLFGTERSLPYPNGHRNTIFAQRGVRALPILAAERRGDFNTGDLLYPYLRRNAGITTSHTSGSDQGTDWRDSDPEVEPVVELYQSLHASYEYPGAPRAETLDKRYFHHGSGWKPDGFVWEAWAKGIRLGVQASSDHVGVHDSYAAVLVPADEPLTRQHLIDAMKQRHTYAATDNIIVDVRIGDHIMGDAFSSSETPVIRVNAIGTRPLDRVVLIRDNEFIHTVNPGRSRRSSSIGTKPPSAAANTTTTSVSSSPAGRSPGPAPSG